MASIALRLRSSTDPSKDTALPVQPISGAISTSFSDSRGPSGPDAGASRVIVSPSVGALLRGVSPSGSVSGSSPRSSR